MAEAGDMVPDSWTTDIISCGFKTAYDTKYEATEKIKRIRKAERKKPKRRQSKVIPTRAYQCNNCGLWHLTSKPVNPRAEN